MPPGPTPKSAETRQRRNKTSTAATLDGGTMRIRIPAKLPEPRIVLVGNAMTGYTEQLRDWHPAAVAWWKEIRKSPMAAEYVQADLAGLYLLIDLYDLYCYGRKDLAAEIRLQRQCFGLTPIDRRRLQWEVQKVDGAEKKQPPAAPVNSEPSSDPRRLLSVV